MSASSVSPAAVDITSSDRSSRTRPSLQIVPRAADAAVVAAAGPQDGDVGRWAAIGAAIGFTVLLVAVTVAGTVGGVGFGASLGVGLFVGFWGGAGFGFMMGATIPLALRTNRASATHANHEQGARNERPTR